METILEKIRQFADAAHGSQMRKYTPERYIVHPIRVMETLRKYDDSLPVLAAALLHDVLEDTPVTPKEMLEFLLTVMNNDDANETLRLVIELTDVYIKADYPQLNRRERKRRELERIVQTSPKAQTIKYADILDNTSEITSHDPGFAPRFLHECLDNLKGADKGNKELYQIALTEVQNKLQNLRGLTRSR
jgi:guanosine-3',5'-bis(diphosphate) 3'-pyrophosphohydrolase